MVVKAQGRPGPGGPEAAGGASLSPEAHEKLKLARSRIATAFAQATMLLMNTPRYRHQTLADLEGLVLEPLLRDRIAIASAKPNAEGEADGALIGLAFWASVSAETGAKIAEQVRAGTLPVRLKPAEWDGGEEVWLLDVVAPDRRLASAVLSGFGQIAKGRPVRIHPLVTRLVEPDLLRKLQGAPAPNPAAPD